MSEGNSRAIRFSVVVPACNAEATLAQTLDAILAQRYGDWECVVVDDGSKDATLSVARVYAQKDPRVRALTQANQGTGGAYNTGVAASVGQFIVICSADDLLLPEHLAEVSRHFDVAGACDICSTNGFLLSPDGSTELMYGPDDDAVSLDLIQVIRACFYSVGAAYRREVFDLAGGYRVGVFGEDYDFWLRAMSLGARHCYIPKALSMHRLSPTQKSSDGEAALRSDVRILTDLENSGRLSRQERKAVHDSVSARLAHIARQDPMPVRRMVGIVLVYLGHPGSLWRGIVRRMLRPASRTQR